MTSIRCIFVDALVFMGVLFFAGLFLIFVFPVIFAVLVVIFAIRTVGRWSSEIDEECDEEW